ncbi:MAG: PLP-dependent cysteine synthase family protein [Fimbriimonadaceae bacterium]
MKCDTILGAIGGTPHVRINRLFGAEIEVWIKLEKQNPGGSLKDRTALAMVEKAEEHGELEPGGTILVPSSGNAGIGMALVAAVKGYRLIVTMPESMSIERQRALRAYGAEIVLTSHEGWLSEAVSKAQELAHSLPGAWLAQQFDDAANGDIHESVTAREIESDFPEGLDVMVGGVGTGGHLCGVAKHLKSIWPSLHVIAIEPSGSAVLSGGKSNPHKVLGIGAGFVPSGYDGSVVDEVLAVSDNDAYTMARRCAKEEGIWGGVSTGANLAAVRQKLPEMMGKRVLTWNYDTGERYLSVDGLFPSE